MNPETTTQKQVLIAEDEADLREPLAMEFESLGFQVFQAANGTEAFNIICANHIDLVISDIRMPGGDGIELLKKIRARNTAMPVVMLITGFADISIEQTYDLGAEAVLSKPFDLDELEATVNRLLLSPELRWSASPHHKPTAPLVVRSYASLNEAQQLGKLGLGRGGIFIAQLGPEERTRIGGDMRLDFRFSQGDLRALQGLGVVRWSRNQETPDLPAGCGIEFVHLAEDIRHDVVRVVQAQNPTAYLPRKA